MTDTSYGRCSSPTIKESIDLIEAIEDEIEKFVSKVRRGKLQCEGWQSFSSTSACEAVELMKTIVLLFGDHEELPDSIGNRMLRDKYPAAKVATSQVKRLIWLISLTGKAILRTQFRTLLLTNVTRRVISCIRSAAAESMASSSELEALAVKKLKELDDTYDNESNNNNIEDEIERQPSSLRGRMFSVASGLLSEDRRQTTVLVSRSRLSKNFNLSSGRLDDILEESEEAVALDEQEVEGNFSSGIPGWQTMRRAPSRPSIMEEEGIAEEYPVRLNDFLNELHDRIDAFQKEIEDMCEDLCKRATKQLHATDTVITIGCTNTTRHYLKKALDKNKPFKVIILEGAPSPVKETHRLADELRNMGAEVQVLHDSSAFAVMNTCTKVLIGAESVLANGGLLAPIGTHPLCIAAKHFAVPVLVATTTLKMSPYYPRDAFCTSLVEISRSSAQEIPWKMFGPPSDIHPMPYGENMNNIDSFLVHAPLTEYVPPELISLYATNESEYTPSQIHPVVRENYNPED